MRGSATTKLLVIGIGAMVAYNMFGPMGLIAIGVALFLIG